MKLNSFLPVVILVLIAALAGFFAGRKTATSPPGILIDTSNVIYFESTDTENAHTMSAKFRRESGWCPGEAACGVFEFSNATANDLIAAVHTISEEVRRATGSSPRFFRCVFGLDAQNNTRLIVAGLDNNNLEHAASVKIIEGHIPCPKLCDIQNSAVIMGSGTTRNPCE